MKKSILTLSVLAFVSGVTFTSCNSPAKKVEIAESNVVKANIELDSAKAEYLADIISYRKEAAEKIAANDKIIADANAKMVNDKKEVKADYKKKIAELEEKNEDLRKKIEGYKPEGKDKWESFKAEFNSDLDALGKAFSDLTLKNVK
jgi:chromosome segregation ATPase